jgi:hypothetical protein
MLTRYGGCQGNKYPGRTKTSPAALQFDIGLPRARGRKKPSSKIARPSRLGVHAAGQPPAHRKKGIAKKPIAQITNKWVQEDVNTLYNLLNYYYYYFIYLIK